MPARAPEMAMSMPILFPLVAALALATVAAPGQAALQDHGHAEGHAAETVATPAQRWATDAPLRAGMREIGAVVEALGHYEHGHMGPDQAALLAGQVPGHIAGIVANCRLEPEADAALHGVLAGLSQGASALATDPADLAAIQSLRQALADYARLFDDPGFEVPST